MDRSAGKKWARKLQGASPSKGGWLKAPKHRERAEKEFNQEIIIQQTLNVYREILLINAKWGM